MALMDFLFGSKGSMKQLPTMSGGQNQMQDMLMKILQGMGGQGGGFQSSLDLLKGMLDPNSQSNQDFENRYRQQYEEETEPQLAERYAGAGALSSSGFGQALGAGRRGLERDLAGMSSQRQMGSAGSLMELFSQMMGQHQNQQTFGYLQTPPTTGLIPGMANAGSKAYFGGF